MKEYFDKISATILYVLPVIFFSVCYFLITTAAEDISQGAGRPVSILSELKEAFLYNPRLGELYTWPMINIFDYQFIFGLDTILRLFDVIMVIMVLFALFIIATARMPRLGLKDAILFALGFLMLSLTATQYSEVFYARFSFIHNYLMITLFFLLFILPYALEVHNKSLPKTKKFFFVSTATGFLFGMSSQVTPIVMLITLSTIFLIRSFVKKPTINIQQVFSSWKAYTIIGILIAAFVMYGLGPGIASHYANDPLLNYVAFSDLAGEPLTSIRMLFYNLFKNILTLLPCILLFIFGAILSLKMTKNSPSKTTPRYLLYAGIFCIIHLLVLSQITFESLLRVTLPIYIVTILVVLFACNVSLRKTEGLPVRVVGSLLCIVCLFVVVDMTRNQISYRQQIQPVLYKIQKSPLNDICVSKSSIKTPVSTLGFHQSPLLEEWAMPMKIYNKNVTFCE